ncbi:hypothetical protein AAV32_15005 [Kerstersia gyiorum]|uniref:Uncharacterized protein n=1 Tax=Kerstersia gyiorum TaxID=206506 RepID=A0A171KPH5_9BURK|nr:hypothetical protein AAV32_15005 [Kerstersia gyiorum]
MSACAVLIRWFELGMDDKLVTRYAVSTALEFVENMARIRYLMRRCRAALAIPRRRAGEQVLKTCIDLRRSVEQIQQSLRLATRNQG